MLKQILILWLSVVGLTGGRKIPRPVTPKIHEAKPHQFPFLGRAIYKNETTGETQNEIVILVGRRCVLAKGEHLQHWKSFEVIFGETRPFGGESGLLQRFVPSSDVMMPERDEQGYDLAIIKFTDKWMYDGVTIKPPLLPNWDETELDYTGENATVIGWQRAKDGYSIAYQHVIVRDFYWCGDRFDFDTLCVTDNIGDILQPGSPLAINTTQGLKVIGIYTYRATKVRRKLKWPSGKNPLIWSKAMVPSFVFIQLNKQLGFIVGNTGLDLQRKKFADLEDYVESKSVNTSEVENISAEIAGPPESAESEEAQEASASEEGEEELGAPEPAESEEEQGAPASAESEEE